MSEPITAPDRRPAPAEPSRRWLVVLVAACLLSYGAGISAPGRFLGDELFYARSAAEMVWTGDWRVPVYEGAVRHQKPPAEYWLVAVSYELFGVSLAAARIPSVLLSAVGIVLAERLGRLLFGSRRAGLYGAAALLSSYAFYRHGRWAITDTLLCVATLGSFVGFAEAVLRGRRAGATLGWVALAIATLTKGPVAPVVAAISLAIFAWTSRRERTVLIRRVADPLGVALFAALLGGWLWVYVTTVGAQDAATGTSRELSVHLAPELGRFLSAVGYYGLAVLRALGPWALPLALFRHREERDPSVRWLIAWILAVLIPFMLLVRNMRLRYLVIGTPALAILSGGALARLEAREGLRSPWVRLFLAAFLGLFAMAGAIAILLLLPLARLVHSPALTVAAFAQTGLAASLLAVSPWLWRRGRFHELVVGASIGTVLLLGVYYGAWAPAAVTEPTFEIGRTLAGRLPPSPTVATVGLDAQDRAFLSIGAATPVRIADPELSADGDFSAIEAARPDVIVARLPTLEAMPRSLRAAYREESRVPGGGLRLEAKVGWRHLLGRRVAPRQPKGDLVVLRRAEGV